MTATAANSVALGYNSAATQANTVSVGAVGSERRIVNVADGTGATDAVNLRQLNVVNSLVNAAISQNAAQDTRLNAIDALNAAQDSRLSSLETSFANIGANMALVDNRAEGGIAAAMAMSGMMIPADAEGAASFNLATYRGEQGFSGVIVQKLAPKVYANFGISGSTVKGTTGARIGVTFGW